MTILRSGSRTSDPSPVQQALHGVGALVHHVGVELRGLGVLLTEEFLHCADVVAALEQVRREAVAKRVTGGGLLDAGGADRGTGVAPGTRTASLAGRPEEKSLKRLGEEMSELLPALANPVEAVRKTGNRIFHPRKHDAIAHPKDIRSEALECIHVAHAVLEAAHSALPPR